MKRTVIIGMVLFFGLSVVKAQNILLENVKGEKQNFAEIIEGNTPVIVSFWATWCKPCIMEMEALKEIKSDWEDNVRIVSVSIDDSRSKGKVISFVKGKNYPFEIYMDPNQSLYKSLNVPSIPFTLIFKDGKQVYMHSGYNPGDETFLVEEALKHSN